MAATPSVAGKPDKDVSAWHGFQKGVWHNEINVCDFIQQNYRVQPNVLAVYGSG